MVASVVLGYSRLRKWCIFALALAGIAAYAGCDVAVVAFSAPRKVQNRGSAALPTLLSDLVR